MSTDYAVEITDSGRSGGIRYREGDGREYSTWWELAGDGGVLAFIAVTTPMQWDAQVPWAIGRREEILTRIGQETIRQKACNYSFVIEEDFINIVRARHSSNHA